MNETCAVKDLTVGDLIRVDEFAKPWPTPPAPEESQRVWLEYGQSCPSRYYCCGGAASLI
jgi:hypothetical protein